MATEPVANFGEQIADLIDLVAGDAYEGWAEYWTGPEREEVEINLTRELERWQRFALERHDTEERGK